jgi:hypothetical protein
MAQAGDVPNLLCAQITGGNDNSSKNPTRTISARLFSGLAECAPRIDARVYNKTLCGGVISIFARSAS